MITATEAKKISLNSVDIGKILTEIDIEITYAATEGDTRITYYVPASFTEEVIGILQENGFLVSPENDGSIIIDWDV